MPKPEKPTKDKAKAWLKAHGYEASKVDAESFDDVIESVVKLHGKTLAEYKQGGLGSFAA